MVSKKKSNFFLTAISILLILLFFGFVVFPRAIEWRVKHYFQEKFGTTIAYDAVKWEASHLIFSNIHIQSEEKLPIEYEITAESLKLGYSFAFTKRVIALDIEIERPKLSVLRSDGTVYPIEYFQEKFEENEGDLPFFISLSKKKKSRFIYTDIHYKINNGWIEFLGPGAAVVLSERIEGMGHVGTKKSLNESFHVSYGNGAEQKDGTVYPLSIAFDKEKNQTQVQVKLQELDCSGVTKAVEFLYGPSNDIWNLKQGIATGQLIVNIAQASFVEGEIALKDAVIEHALSGIGAQIHAVDILCSKTSLEVTSAPSNLLESILKSTTAKAVLSKGASLYRFKEGLPFWMLRNISGGVFLNENEDKGVRLGFNGQFFFNKDQVAQVALSGSLPLESMPGEDIVKAGLHITSAGVQDVSAELVIKEAINKNKEIHLSIENISPREYETVRNVWPEWSFVWDELDFIKGSLSCEINATLYQNETLSKISIDNIDARELWFNAKSLSIEGYVTNLVGNMDFSLKSNEKSLVPKNGFLKLSGGDFYWESKSAHADSTDSLERLTGLESSLILKDGILQEGRFKGNLGGMKADLEFYGLNSEVVAKILIDGQAEKVLSLLPSPWALKLQQVSKGDLLSWNGELRHLEEGLLLSGELLLKDVQNEISVIHVNAELERVAATSFDKANLLWKRWGVSLMERQEGTLLPFQRRNSSRILKVNWLKDALGTWGVVLEKGSIKSDRFSFEKYLSPFVFPSGQGSVRGISAFTGDFNDQSLLVHFKIQDFVVDTVDFKVAAPIIGNENAQETSQSAPSSFFYMDFQENSNYLFLPIRQGSYEEKASSLLFTDLHALVSFSKSKLQISDLSGITDEVRFKGLIHVDFKPEDMCELHFETDNVQGDASAVQKLCTHFSDSPFWHIPLQGKFSSHKQGVVIDAKIPYDARKSQLTWSVRGLFSDGGYAFADFDTVIREASLEFMYDSNTKLFEVMDAKGEVIVADHDHYSFSVPSSSYSFSDTLKSHFDMTVNTADDEEFIRFLGEVISDQQDEHIRIIVDEKTHIGGLYPNIDKLILSKALQLNTLKARPKLALSNSIDLLRRLSLANIVPIPDSQISSWSLYPLEGEVRGDFNIDESGFLCTFKGDDVSYNGKPVEKCSFKAEGSQDKWSIDYLQIGSFILDAHLKKEQDRVLVQELHASDSGINLIAAGEYDLKEKLLELKINELKLSLADLKVTKNWRVLAQLWRPEGKIFFSGDLKADFSNGFSHLPFQTYGKLGFESIKIRGNRIQNQADIPVSFSSSEGLKLEGLDINVQQSDQLQYKASFNLNKVIYNFEEETLRLHGLGFSLAGTYLRELALLGRDFFPDLFDDHVLAFLRDIKREGGLQGFLNIDISPTQVLVGLELKDGVYTLFGKEYDLKNVSMRCTPTQISVQADYQLEETALRIRLVTDRPEANKGIALISVVNDSSNTPLKVFWRWDDLTGLVIQSIEGSLGGVFLQMQEQPDSLPHRVAFTGQVKLQDISKLLILLPKKWQSSVTDLKIGNGYLFTGLISLARDSWNDPHVRGVVEGKDFSLYGFEFDLLKANFFYGNHEVLINQCVITDKAGKIMVPTLSIKPEAGNQYRFTMPLLRMEEFKPNAFSKDKQKTKGLKNLVIHEAEIKNLSGLLGNLSSFKGSGFFRFEKIVKNTFANVVLAIPSEILGTIGLNTNILTPASGTVQFTIRDQRVYITNLQDVYSEGKKSRFYLPQGPIQSYVDFDGNLNLYIKLKQHNLLLKLAESLQFHVTGKLDNPKFTMEKGSSKK